MIESILLMFNTHDFVGIFYKYLWKEWA